MRVVRGLPTSWDPVHVTTYHGTVSGEAVWSPCNRFIALAKSAAIEILDAGTLERLDTFKLPRPSLRRWLSFSPDSRTLTVLDQHELTSLDLQMGSSVSAFISAQTVDFRIGNFPSFAYSVDGKVIAVLDASPQLPAPISTFDLLSVTHTCSLRAPEGCIITPIWTHGESLRFVTLKPGSITVWEVSFTLGHTPELVQSLPAPDEVIDTGDGKFLFLPVLSQLAFTIRDTVFIWDTQNSRFLLKSRINPIPQTAGYPWMSFSSDGGFFLCTIGDQGVHVWKKSPIGYTLCQTLALPPHSRSTRPLLSPNGKLIIAAGQKIARLWHTRDQFACEKENKFILVFSTNELLAAFARSGGNMVTILDLRSGDLRLTIDAGLEVLCLGMTESAVAVVGWGKVITWNIPVECCDSAKVGIDDSAHTTTLDFLGPASPIEGSISPDLTRIAITRHSEALGACLQIHDASSGRQLAGVEIPHRFVSVAQDESRVWWKDLFKETKGWKIIEDRESLTTKLEPLETTAYPPPVFPWQSRHGYKVTRDGWVLSPTQKRLLWLPHRWRRMRRLMVWSGRFLGLGQPEAIIFEFFN